ncbi:MAG TPA: fumarylacetoacetate hydrolase family protein [Solirubrobacteraceae bacterium]|nr:fumarylacetoacetate hydrolase family protein [Solirubrobacteraceae bacterium]
MRLATFLAPGDSKQRAGELREGELVAYGGDVSVRDLLGHDSPGAADGERWALDDVTLLAPVPDARAIYGIGLNYASHAAETGAEPPEQPIVFAKMTGSIAPPGGPVRCPAAVRRLDYEGELCVVIGAAGGVGGYAVADDVSGRDLQGREAHWVRGKGADTFCPFGPWVTTADEVPDAEDLRLRTWVNGELRQDSRTSDLIFGVDELIAFLSQTHTLRPGDLILTGTPAGVGIGSDPMRLLADGDTVRIEIERLGAIEHRVEIG